MIDPLSQSGLPYLAERLNRLIDMYRWVDHDTGATVGFRSNQQLADALTHVSEPTSRAHVSLLRAGHQDNPSARLISALSQVFEVSPAYWFDEEVASQVLQTLLDRTRPSGDQ
ncbi:MAG: hypothetical protein L0H79_06965 [Intrasporangium sp.]|uniref:hypothetical protein n=1 Tax=Intrasporangium sp. TaxID=1925024 RepID=UPI002648B827|nr:hypothetical protein [Intrasporangium sp.]MDN5795479.1 hypothetical protein [Intrasporangium sp.]